MRTIRFAAPVAALIMTLAACSNPESSTADPAKAPASTTAKSSNEPLLGPEDAVTSQEDADKQAEQAINEDNADAELEKLEKELGGGGGGG